MHTFVLLNVPGSAVACGLGQLLVTCRRVGAAAGDVSAAPADERGGRCPCGCGKPQRCAKLDNARTGRSLVRDSDMVKAPHTGSRHMVTDPSARHHGAEFLRSIQPVRRQRCEIDVEVGCRKRRRHQGTPGQHSALSAVATLLRRSLSVRRARVHAHAPTLHADVAT